MSDSMKKGGLLDGAGSEPEEWITVENGESVPILDGQDKGEAIQAHFEKIDQQKASNDYESIGLKGQIQANLARLNQTDSIFEISESDVTDHYERSAQMVQAKLDHSSGIVKRDGFGEIQVSSRLAKAKAYIKTTAEKTAVLAVPTVIEKGIQIAEHRDHKGRAYPTYTFAGKISIGGKTGIIGVVVKRTEGNFYKVHRVLDSTGKTLDIEKTTD